MNIIAIDPGETHSAYVVCRGDEGEKILDVQGRGKVPNDEIFAIIDRDYDLLCIEQIASYGMPVGEDVFETVYWSGRFAQFWLTRNDPNSLYRIPRKDVKLQLCMSLRAKDANVRQALIDRYGGKAAIKKGGPLHGVSKDVWAALGVAVTFWETRKLR